MNRYHLTHVTEFHYDGPVSESYNEVRLRPMHDDRQSCLSFRLTTSPASRTTSYRDAFGNWVHQFNVLGPHRQSEGPGRLRGSGPRIRSSCPTARPSRTWISNTTSCMEEFYDFVAPTEYVPHLPDLDEFILASERQSGGKVAGFAQAISDVIHQRFEYVKGATHVRSSIQDSISARAGVCQDFAHVLLGIARKRGLPARYVSGYMVPESSVRA